MGFWDTVNEGLSESLAGFTSGFANSLVAIIIITAFFIIGYAVAWMVSKIIKMVFKKMDFQGLLEKAKVPGKFAGYTIQSILILLVKIFIIMAFVAAATDLPMVNLGVITDVIKWIIGYIPILLQGIIVIIAAVMFASYVSSLITQSKKIPLSSAIAFIIQIFIGYAALVIAIPLILPNANVGILEKAFEWFVAALAIAMGIGIGIAVGFSLKKPIEEAAEKHPEIFEGLLSQFAPAKRRKK